MRTYIISALVALGIGAVTATAIVTNAATGDAVYIKRGAHVTLSGAQKTTAASCFEQVWPGMVKSKIVRVYLRRDSGGNVWGTACDAYAPTNAELLRLEASGQLGVQLTGGEFERCAEPVALSTSQQSCWSGLVSSTHSGVDISKIVDYSLARDPVTTTTIYADTAYAATANADTYVADRQAGLVVKLVGIAD